MSFTSLQAWEDDRDGNLVAEDRREIGLVYNDGPLAGTLTIDGSTTDPHRFLQLQAAPVHLHSGVAGTGVILDPTVNGHAVEVLDHYIRMDWLEIRGWQGAGSSGVRIGAHNTSFHGLLVHDPDPMATDADGFSMDSGGDWLAIVRNSIVYNVRRAGFQIQNPAGSRQPAFKLDNVTVYNCGGSTTTPSLTGGVSLCEAPLHGRGRRSEVFSPSATSTPTPTATPTSTSAASPTAATSGTPAPPPWRPAARRCPSPSPFPTTSARGTAWSSISVARRPRRR